jgi:hypothetical protein
MKKQDIKQIIVFFSIVVLTLVVLHLSGANFK